jgi:hypothetical protein
VTERAVRDDNAEMEFRSPRAALSLPVGSVLVHLGPYKTGTTAIQTSLDIHREDLRRHGVLYPGTAHRQVRPGWALLERTPRGVGRVPVKAWEEMVEEIRVSDLPRVCISTEDLASARPKHISRLAEDLGADRVWVLMTVRRLDKLLPSAWQSRVKSSNEALPYDAWLSEVLADVPSAKAPGHRFWFNQSVAKILQRWSGTIPAERFVLLVADESDRDQQMRTFERLLDVPEGTLTPGPRNNSSLTLDRTELLRRVNVIFDERGWDDAHRRHLIHRGMLNGLATAEIHETERPIPSLPRWAARRVAELSERRIEEVTGSGALVLGDPELLRFTVGEHQEDLEEFPRTVRLEVAASAVEGVVAAVLKQEPSALKADARQGRTAAAPLTSTDGVSSRELLGIAARRQLRRLKGLRRP